MELTWSHHFRSVASTMYSTIVPQCGRLCRLAIPAHIVHTFARSCVTHVLVRQMWCCISNIPVYEQGVLLPLCPRGHGCRATDTELIVKGLKHAQHRRCLGRSAARQWRICGYVPPDACKAATSLGNNVRATHLDERAGPRDQAPQKFRQLLRIRVPELRNSPLKRRALRLKQGTECLRLIPTSHPSPATTTTPAPYVIYACLTTPRTVQQQRIVVSGRTPTCCTISIAQPPAGPLVTCCGPVRIDHW